MMKVKYKIISAFTILGTVLIVFLSIYIYLTTFFLQKQNFYSRLKNRALTINALFSKTNNNDFHLLSQVDSSTTNLLFSEDINIYDAVDKRIYHYSRNNADTINIAPQFINAARSNGQVEWLAKDKQAAGFFFNNGDNSVVVIVSASDKNGSKTLSDLRLHLISGMVIGILLSALFGWIFSEFILNPLKKIVRTVNNISANNIEDRLPLHKTNDEWKQLMLTFNELLTRLQMSFDMQSRFVSNASHELSTPLTSISNQIDVVLRKERTKEEYLQVLQSVLMDVKHLNALTEQLLNLARTAKGGSVKFEEIRIDELLMEMPLIMNKTDSSYKVQLFFDEFPEDEKKCMVFGNRELLLSAIKNITENGCKFSPVHTIKISLSFIENKILLLFTNSIHAEYSSEEMETFFEPFQRGHDFMQIKGHGLGLSLSRRVLLLHKGEIKADIPELNIFRISVLLPAVE